MKDLKITPDKWEITYDNSDEGFGQWLSVGPCKLEVPYNLTQEEKKEWEDNAKLVQDAANNYHECGLLPSELLEQRNELLEALKQVHKDMWNHGVSAYFDSKGIKNLIG